jgi:hypothetical protein
MSLSSYTVSQKMLTLTIILTIMLMLILMLTLTLTLMLTLTISQLTGVLPRPHIFQSRTSPVACLTSEAAQA